MDKFLLRPAKRARGDGDVAPAEFDPPGVIVSWNCNSLRMRVDRREIAAAVAAFLGQGAQAIVLQEVRLKPEDRAACENALRSAGLSDWRFYWSLHPDNKRYSGTALAVHPAYAPLAVRFDLRGLVDLGIKYPLVANSQKAAASEDVSRDPEREGRLVIAEYGRCWLVCVYVPLCSWYAAGRAVRAAWDARFSSAIQTLQRGLPAKSAASSQCDGLQAAVAPTQAVQPALQQAVQGNPGQGGEDTARTAPSLRLPAPTGVPAAVAVAASSLAVHMSAPLVAAPVSRTDSQPSADTTPPLAGLAPRTAASAQPPTITSLGGTLAGRQQYSSTATVAGSTCGTCGGTQTAVRSPSGSLRPSKITAFFGPLRTASPPGSTIQSAAQDSSAYNIQQPTNNSINNSTQAPGALPQLTRAPDAPDAATAAQAAAAPASAPPAAAAAAAAGLRTASGGVLGKPVIVAGDLNVCHTALDVSHPDFFAAAMKPRNVGGGDPGLPGQPGYCEDERERFGRLLLSDCRLVDSWRALHPGGKRLTWGWAPNFEVGRYAGKYMGLDYFLVDQKLWAAGLVVSSEILGSSARDCFGSDHVPVLLRCDWARVGSSAGVGVRGAAQ